MNIKCTYDRSSSYPGAHDRQIMELEGVELDYTVNTREILPYLEFSEILEWLNEMGYSVTQERVA